MTDSFSLLRRAKQGDQQAFAKLYETLFTPLYRYVFMETRHRETAEDITQTVFVKAWQHLQKSD
ncbi:MAG: hypothetical protein HYV45_01935 [Candidatus Moranbacteria bacterium]|nr:hypothetical protein [Candidatus Moranbacteria bacterium]